MKKNKLLFISMCLPFSRASNAGGKTLDFYINAFTSDDANEVRIIAKVLPSEEKELKNINKKAKLYPVSRPKNKIRLVASYIKSVNSKINPFYRYGNSLTKDIYIQIEKRIRQLKKENYYPDVIFLEWTQMVLFIDTIKKYYPLAKYIASEVDVSYLGKYRKAISINNCLKKGIYLKAYSNFKENELIAVDKCNLVIVQNNKDKNLLIRDGINGDKIHEIVPYYDNYSIKRYPNKKDIIFYGAMNRIENSLSAEWFIDEVMPLLVEYNVRFIVIGNKPPKSLTSRQSDRVVVTGFVQDPSVYFKDAMCLVAPLLLGAGIKVKILEALSAGLPVLTNDIGIEGIKAINGIDYIHCNTPEEYMKSIVKLIEDDSLSKFISINANNCISNNYNLSESSKLYSERIKSLIKETGENTHD